MLEWQLPHKHGVLGSIPGSHVKTLSVTECACHRSARETDDLVAQGPVRLAYGCSPDLSGRSCLKQNNAKQTQSKTKKPRYTTPKELHARSISELHTHVCTYMSTHTWPPPQTATSTYTTQRHFRIWTPIADHTTAVTFETFLLRLALEMTNMFSPTVI